jgi:TPR repeat protein
MAATGQSGTVNLTGAHHWLAKACDDGHLGYACYLSGMLNDLGKGVGTSKRRARAQYQKGCTYKDARSCAKLKE